MSTKKEKKEKGKKNKKSVNGVDRLGKKSNRLCLGSFDFLNSLSGFSGYNSSWEEDDE